jgi:hypothetical protein
MPKSLFVFLWTLLVAVIAFTAGRWAAVPEAINDVSALTTASTPLQTSQASYPLADKNTAPRVQQLASKKPSLKGGRSYASDNEQLQVLLALAATNPQAAMEQTQAFRGAIKAKAQAAILDIWAARDAYGAWSWVQSFQPDNNAQFIKLLEVIGRNEPQAAVTYAEKFLEGHREFRKDIYLSAVTGITQAGAYTLAADWVNKLEIEPDTKTELISFVASAWAAYEPQAAMQWLMKQPQTIQISAIDSVSAAWADVDPQGATHFASTLSGTERQPMLQDSFKKWLAEDSAAASTWLAAAPNQTDLDSLINEVATQPNTSNGEVKTALAWAEKVHDSALRLNAVRSILSSFKARDPIAAAAYLQELSYISSAERTQLAEDLALGQ